MCSMTQSTQTLIIVLHMSVITQDGYSALIWAAMHGHVEVVVELVKAKASLDLQNEVCMFKI